MGIHKKCRERKRKEKMMASFAKIRGGSNLQVEIALLALRSQVRGWKAEVVQRNKVTKDAVAFAKEKLAEVQGCASGFLSKSSCNELADRLLFDLFDETDAETKEIVFCLASSLLSTESEGQKPHDAFVALLPVREKFTRAIQISAGRLHGSLAVTFVDNFSEKVIESSKLFLEDPAASELGQLVRDEFYFELCNKLPSVLNRTVRKNFYSSGEQPEDKLVTSFCAVNCLF